MQQVHRQQCQRGILQLMTTTTVQKQAKGTVGAEQQADCCSTMPRSTQQLACGVPQSAPSLVHVSPNTQVQAPLVLFTPLSLM